jgi:hypothetical protein
LDKEVAEGGGKRQVADARRKETQRREEKRESRVAERQRFKKAKKAHMYHANGQKKLGREGVFLLEKVKRMMGGA